MKVLRTEKRCANAHEEACLNQCNMCKKEVEIRQERTKEIIKSNFKQ